VGFLPLAGRCLDARPFDMTAGACDYHEPMLVERELVAANVSPVAFSPSPKASSVAFNASRKWALFASRSSDDCKPLQLRSLLLN
jgi:hypothetical protein